MLRSLIVAFGALCFLGGLVALLMGLPSGFMATIGGAVLLVGTLYEQVRYKPVVTSKPGPNWTKTAERFYDDQTGKLLTVYIQPETGERSYVEE